MNIRIVNSWLREFLDTKASPNQIANQLSLTSVSVERTEYSGTEHIYNIEITTNRVDLMSVMGIAKEASATLTEQGITAKYIHPRIPNPPKADISFPIEIVGNPKLVNRIMAVVLEVEIEKSPKLIKDRLELSGIRSLNNIIDVTNYVMREIGHPTHVFDFDLLNTKKMIIRESKHGEVITTLDGKQYRLTGGDIVADNGKGEIIDLLGVMGTANSVVHENTKRILFFLDNNNPRNIRQTSMNLGIRTEAAIINEKGIDPELMPLALNRGIELYQKIAKGKVVSKIFDYYPNKPKKRFIRISNDKINKVIGIEIRSQKSFEILEKLGFGVKKFSNYLEMEIPSIRDDVRLEEDLIEEIARVYGYHKLPIKIPEFLNNKPYSYSNSFYFEDRVRNAFKYWGYTEVYTYSLVSEDFYDGPIEKAVKLKNPLTEDMKYLRNSLVPSLLKVVEENKSVEIIKIFELANVYHKKDKDLPAGRHGLPKETLMISGAVKKRNISFFEIKGLIEQLLEDLGIKSYKFKSRGGSPGAEVLIVKEKIGYVEILNSNLVDFELNFESILEYASLKKAYKQLAKFPSITEDMTFVLDEKINTEQVIEEIKLQSFLITSVTLKDEFENPASPAGRSKTFHIIYQAEDKNLTNQEIAEIRKQIIKSISEKFKAKVK